MTSQPLDVFLTRARGRIDDALDQCLPRPPACPPLIAEAMRYSVFAGGKRLRPCLTLAAADAVLRRGAYPHLLPGLDDEPDGSSSVFTLALPPACAVELIHTYSLIHDDLPAMDNDTLRRGRPTLHVVYGDGIAILAGDGLQAEAFALLAREPVTDDPAIASRKLRALAVISEAARATGLVGGQTVDLQAAGLVPGHPIRLDAAGLQEMHARKTGAMIRASAVSGAVMAGASEPVAAAIDGFAAELGLAFQIIDDILDVEGSASELGKTAGKDAAAAKPTYPALFGIDRSRAMAGDCIARARDALAKAELTDGWLWPIAEWILQRKN